MRAPVVFGNKVRHGHDERAEMLDIIGDVKGKNVLIVDDFTISGGTLIEMANACKERGARDVYACVSHGVFSKGSAAKIAGSPIKELVLTDTIGHPLRAAGPLLHGRQRRPPVRRGHPLDPPPRERQPAVRRDRLSRSLQGRSVLEAGCFFRGAGAGSSTPRRRDTTDRGVEDAPPGPRTLTC